MPITPAKDKASIKSILNADPLMTTLGFTAVQTFLYKNSDQTIDPTKVQIFYLQCARRKDRKRLLARRSLRSPVVCIECKAR